MEEIRSNKLKLVIKKIQNCNTVHFNVSIRICTNQGLTQF